MSTSKIFVGALLFNLIFTHNAIASEDSLYPSSVVGTDFDYITATDPNTFLCMEYGGIQNFEMPDKRSDGPIQQDAYIFDTYYSDGTQVRIALDNEFTDKKEAQQVALRYTSRLGKLPTTYRDPLKHIVVHKGGVNTTSFAEDAGKFFVVYSDNTLKRITTNDLEETFFHEGTHASIQLDNYSTTAWKNAQVKDGAYVTNYARTNNKEDFAESALFAYTIIHNPERLPANERAKIEKMIPNRIAFFETIYTKPLTYKVADAYVCSKDATFPNDAPSEVNIVVPTVDTNPIPTAVEPYGNDRDLDEVLQDVLVITFKESESEVKEFLTPWRATRDREGIFAATIQEFGYSEAQLTKELETYGYFINPLATPTIEEQKSILIQLKNILQQLFRILGFSD